MKPLSNRFLSTAARSLGCLTLFVLLTGAAQAHPGHGLLERGVAHAFTSPVHVALLAVMGVTLFGGAHLIQRRLPRRAMQGLGAFLLLVSVVCYGLRA